MRRIARSAAVAIRRALSPRRLAVLVIFAVPTYVLLSFASGIYQYGPNLALNLGADLIGSFVVLAAITPILRRVQRGQVLEHPRMNFDWYNDRLAVARRQVRIMHTFSRLFGDPYQRRFFRLLNRVLEEDGFVEILLMAPDSDAARQRTLEIANPKRDVAREIRANLRRLDRYRGGMKPEHRQRFEVRLYDVSPAVTLYQWDERALVSFLPLGFMSGDTVQLETSVDSGLGQYANGQFNQLWRQAIPLDDYLQREVTIAGQPVTTAYVALDGACYLAGSLTAAPLARGGDPLIHMAENWYRGEVVADHTDEEATLRRLFRDKYGQDEDTFVRLVAAGDA